MLTYCNLLSLPVGSKIFVPSDNESGYFIDYFHLIFLSQKNKIIKLITVDVM